MKSKPLDIYILEHPSPPPCAAEVHQERRSVALGSRQKGSPELMDARTYSHPARWMFGGILDLIKWGAGSTKVRCWDGREESVSNGEEVLVLRTATHVEMLAVVRGDDA